MIICFKLKESKDLKEGGSTMSRQRLLVIGADAAGMTAASQARRQSSELDITAFERGAYTSYSA